MVAPVDRKRTDPAIDVNLDQLVAVGEQVVEPEAPELGRLTVVGLQPESDPQILGAALRLRRGIRLGRGAGSTHRQRERGDQADQRKCSSLHELSFI